MQVRIKQGSIANNRRVWEKGDIYECANDAEGYRMIQGGIAEPVEIETGSIAPPEQASKRRGRPPKLQTEEQAHVSC